MLMVVPLSRMCEGERGTIRSLELPGDISERLCGMGFVNGEEVQLLKVAPFGDPKVFRVKGTNITLRNDIAMWILVETSSTSLSSAREGSYTVSAINGGWGFIERLKQAGIEEGISIRVKENTGRRVQLEVRGRIIYLPRGQAMRVIIKER